MGLASCVQLRICVLLTQAAHTHKEMTMTKKHFIRLAEYIRDAAKYSDVPFTDAQINHLADFCHEANPRFNRERWIGFIRGRVWS